MCNRRWRECTIREGTKYIMVGREREFNATCSNLNELEFSRYVDLVMQLKVQRKNLHGQVHS